MVIYLLWSSTYYGRCCPIYKRCWRRHHQSWDEIAKLPHFVLFLAQYRKSFPSVSTSFPSPIYRDHSADESSTSSPQSLRRAGGPDGQPCYQFRKSNSMKLALKEDVEGDWKLRPRCLRRYSLLPVHILSSVIISDHFRLQFFSGRWHELCSVWIFLSCYCFQWFLFWSFSVAMQVIFCCFKCCLASVHCVFVGF